MDRYLSIAIANCSRGQDWKGRFCVIFDGCLLPIIATFQYNYCNISRPGHRWRAAREVQPHHQGDFQSKLCTVHHGIRLEKYWNKTTTPPSPLPRTEILPFRRRGHWHDKPLSHISSTHTDYFRVGGFVCLRTVHVTAVNNCNVNDSVCRSDYRQGD